MGMRIRTNVNSLVAQRFMERNNGEMNSSLERLASGYRINKSSDDAAGLAISENLRGQLRGLNVAKRNANDAVSMVQVAEGGMNEMTNILIRLRELTVQSASDTIGDKERSFLNREYTQLVDEMDRIGNSTEFNGRKMFAPDGGLAQFVVQIGTRGTTPEANSDTITINLEGIKFNSNTLGLGKGTEIGAQGDDSPLTRTEIADKLTTIDDALGRMASERATLGAVQNRLGSAIGNLGVSMENQQLAMSRIRDVDYAAETASLTQAKIMTQANVSVLSQANAAPEMALQLLR
ncbi:MAG: flagellin [Proteobacteria bacterium]|nr:flagellin [Pseudomonadota bacterium]